MANISKYTFDEVEGKLDTIKKDQGSDKVLKGDGTYGSVTVSQDDIDNSVKTYLQENPIDNIWDGKTIDLVLFQGQSNMAGMAEPPSEADLVCTHGWQFHHANYKNGVTDSILIPIVDGFGSGDTFYHSDYCADVNEGVHRAGLQLSFACRYFELNKVPIVGVSCSFPGMNSNKFTPSSTDVNPNWNVQTNTKMNDAITYLESQGYIIRNKYAMYLQGESDGDESFSADKHKSNLRAIFDSYKTSWGCEKIILIRIGNSNDSTNYNKYRTILQAENDLVYENDDIIMGSMMASTFRDRGLMVDEWHYSLKGYRELGYDIANTMHYYDTYGSQRPLMDKETEVLFPSVRVTTDGIRVKINGVWCTLGAGGGSETDKVPTSITLDKQNLTLNIDGTYQLVPTVEPSDVDAKIGYNSSDASVTVTSNGLVTGVSEGNATITAYCIDYPTVKATCEVEVVAGKANLADVTEYSGSGTTEDSTQTVWEVKTNSQINSGEKLKLSLNIAGNAKIVNDGVEAKIELQSMGALGYGRWYTSNTITSDGIELTREVAQINTLTASNNINAGTVIAKLVIPVKCEYDVSITNLTITKES
jgi:uncharacterized protein YjdB